MSLRVRQNGDVLCAAKHPTKEGDSYIDDGLHYQLSVILGVVVPDSDEETSGRWHWVSYKDWVGPILPGYAAHICNDEEGK